MTTMREIYDEALRLEGSLAERLAYYARGLEANAPELAKAYRGFIATLEARGSGGTAPGIGDVFPDVVLPDEQGRLVRLATLAAEGPVVVSFVRGHWCSFCRLETTALAAIEASIASRGASLVVVSPERAGFSGQLKAAAGLACAVVSDLDLALAVSLGLAVPIDRALREALERNGVDLPLYQGAGHWFLPIPATFVVGSDGRIAARHVEPDFRSRMSPEAVIEAIDGLRPGR